MGLLIPRGSSRIAAVPFRALQAKEALQLASRGLRQFADKLDVARKLVRSQACFHELLQFMTQSIVARQRILQNDKRLRLTNPFSSALAITAASSTAGCAISAASTSTGETQMPLTFSISSLRPQ